MVGDENGVIDYISVLSDDEPSQNNRSSYCMSFWLMSLVMTLRGLAYAELIASKMTNFF